MKCVTVVVFDELAELLAVVLLAEPDAGRTSTGPPAAGLRGRALFKTLRGGSSVRNPNPHTNPS